MIALELIGCMLFLVIARLFVILNILCVSRFSLFVHDETKQEFLDENSNDPKKQELVEQLSTPGYKILEETPSPRFIKTHLPFTLLPKNLLDVGCKVQYLILLLFLLFLLFQLLNK